MLILAGIKPIEEAYRARVQSCTFNAVAEPGVFEPGEMKTLLGLRAAQIRRIIINNSRDGETQTLRIQLVRMSRNDIRLVLDRLRHAPGVIGVDLVERQRSKTREAPHA